MRLQNSPLVVEWNLRVVVCHKGEREQYKLCLVFGPQESATGAKAAKHLPLDPLCCHGLVF